MSRQSSARLPDQLYSEIVWGAINETSGFADKPIDRLKRFREHYWVGLERLGVKPAGPPHNDTDRVWRDVLLAQKVQVWLQEQRGSLQSMGGRPTEDFDETVTLWDLRDGRRMRMGAGVAIAARTLLTAGHCIDALEVGTGRNAAIPALPTRERCHFKDFRPAGDVGLLYLRTQAPDSRLLFATTGEIDAATSGVIVSYSHFVGEGRRTIDAQLAIGPTMIIATSVVHGDQLSDGDSGCPLYVQGAGGPAVAGVLKSASGSIQSEFTRIDSFAAAIVQSLTPPPCLP